VHAFNKDHPEFGLFRDKEPDPGQIHFNHKHHLAREGVKRPDGIIRQLKCTDCHTVDESGRYMQPIKYETHCSECHSLSIQLKGTFRAPGMDQKVLEAAVAEFNSKPAPHVRAEVVRGVMRERLLEFVQKFPVIPGERDRGLFDAGLLGGRGSRAPTKEEWTWTRARVKEVEDLLFFQHEQKETAERMLFYLGGGCRQCHIENTRKPAGSELGG